jgi:hypothetical protein
LHWLKKSQQITAQTLVVLVPADEFFKKEEKFYRKMNSFCKHRQRSEPSAGKKDL